MKSRDEPTHRGWRSWESLPRRPEHPYDTDNVTLPYVQVLAPELRSTVVGHVCETCGKAFLAKRRDARTCSDVCRQARSRGMRANV